MRGEHQRRRPLIVRIGIMFVSVAAVAVYVVGMTGLLVAIIAFAFLRATR